MCDKWIAHCKDIESFDLSELSHDKAWQKAIRQTERTGEDTKISLYDMAASGGASKDMLKVVKERQINRNKAQYSVEYLSAQYLLMCIPTATNAFGALSPESAS